MRSNRILIVEDDESIMEILSTFLDKMGCSTSTAGSAEEALKQLVETDFDVAIVDIILPGLDGMHLLNEIKHVTPDTEVIIMTGHASLETSIEAVRIGAYDYLVKPFDELDEVWFTVERAFEKRNLSMKSRKLQREYKQQNEKLMGLNKRFSSFMKAVREVNSGRSAPELLNYLVDMAASELGVEMTSIMLVDNNSESLSISAAHGMAEDLIGGVSLEIGTGISGKVARSGKPYVLQTKHTKITQDEKNKTESDVEPFHIALSLPIKHEDKTVGVINVPNRPSEEPFNEQDLDFLMGVADLSGIIITACNK